MAEFALANKRNRTMTTKVPPAASAILETHGRRRDARFPRLLRATRKHLLIQAAQAKARGCTSPRDAAPGF